MERKTIEHFITERLSMPVVKAALISGNIEDLESHFKIALMDIAQWRINSMWHSTDELPQRSGYLAVLMENRLMEVIHYTVGIRFQEMTLKGYTSWAYVSDIMPERKEETNGGR